MLKINELNSYLKSKGVPEDSYSINEINDESLCIVEENKNGIYSILKEDWEPKNIVTKMNIWQFYIL